MRHSGLGAELAPWAEDAASEPQGGGENLVRLHENYDYDRNNAALCRMSAGGNTEYIHLTGFHWGRLGIRFDRLEVRFD